MYFISFNYRIFLIKEYIVKLYMSPLLCQKITYKCNKYHFFFDENFPKYEYQLNTVNMIIND